MRSENADGVCVFLRDVGGGEIAGDEPKGFARLQSLHCHIVTECAITMQLGNQKILWLAGWLVCLFAPPPSKTYSVTGFNPLKW